MPLMSIFNCILCNNYVDMHCLYQCTLPHAMLCLLKTKTNEISLDSLNVEKQQALICIFDICLRRKSRPYLHIFFVFL